MNAPSDPEASDPNAPRRADFVSATGARIAGDAWGPAGATPVLFLHGGGQTRHAWGGTARAVAAAGYLAISVDHRGHGESDWDAGGDYSTGAFAADLLAVIAQLGRKPLLVGASLGGITALEAEGASPAPCCLGLVLVDVTPRLELDG